MAQAVNYLKLAVYDRGDLIDVEIHPVREPLASVTHDTIVALFDRAAREEKRGYSAQVSAFDPVPFQWPAGSLRKIGKLPIRKD